MPPSGYESDPTWQQVLPEIAYPGSHTAHPVTPKTTEQIEQPSTMLEQEEHPLEPLG